MLFKLEYLTLEDSAAIKENEDYKEIYVSELFYCNLALNDFDYLLDFSSFGRHHNMHDMSKFYINLTKTESLNHGIFENPMNILILSEVTHEERK